MQHSLVFQCAGPAAVPTSSHVKTDKRASTGILEDLRVKCGTCHPSPKATWSPPITLDGASKVIVHCPCRCKAEWTEFPVFRVTLQLCGPIPSSRWCVSCGLYSLYKPHRPHRPHRLLQAVCSVKAPLGALTEAIKSRIGNLHDIQSGDLAALAALAIVGDDDDRWKMNATTGTLSTRFQNSSSVIDQPQTGPVEPLQSGQYVLHYR